MEVLPGGWQWRSCWARRCCSRRRRWQRGSRPLTPTPSQVSRTRKSPSTSPRATPAACYILNTIEETRESFIKQGITPHFVLAFRGPATLLTQTDVSRLKPEERETASKVAAKLKELRGAAGIERLDQCSIAMRGQKVDKAQVNPDVTIVENGWITLVGYQAKGYAYIAP